MKRLIAFTLALAVVAPSFASPVPKAIKARYAELNKVMARCDFKAFEPFFGPDFVNVDSKGQSTSRKDFMAMLKPIFENSKKGNPREKLYSATTKDGEISVSFDFRYDITGKDGGVTKMHEIGVDTWKKVGGKYVFVKTVDKSMEMVASKKKA